MVVLAKKQAIHAGVDEIWSVLTDAENERKYWTNVRDVKVLSASENRIEREATVGPRAFGQKTKQIMLLEPKRSIKLTITGESVTGERAIMISRVTENETNVEVVWSLQLDGVPGFVDNIVKGQISKMTEEALKKMANEAERMTLKREAA